MFNATKPISGIFFLVASLLLTPATLHAANFGAELTEIEGRVLVTKASTGKVSRAVEGMRIVAGDRIETTPDAAVDILYDDGNVTAMDENTTITIKALTLQAGTKNSVIDLGIGRIKNSVTKIVNIRASFEVQTKSAVAGVTGTPPWVVAVKRDQQGKFSTEVDLLTRGRDSGGLFVRGTDSGATEVLLKPGTRTVSVFGIAPQKPFKIKPARALALKKAVPIKVKPEKREKKRKKIAIKAKQLSKKKQPTKKKIKKTKSKDDSREGVTAVDRKAKEVKKDNRTDKAPVSKEKESVAKSIPPPPPPAVNPDTMLDHVTRSVSVGDVAAPAESETGEATESQTSQTAVTSGAKDAPPPTTRVKIRVDIAR